MPCTEGRLGSNTQNQYADDASHDATGHAKSSLRADCDTHQPCLALACMAAQAS